nr:unnamed protein product [Digitaria exilis]
MRWERKFIGGWEEPGTSKLLEEAIDARIPSHFVQASRSNLNISRRVNPSHVHGMIPPTSSPISAVPRAHV